MQEFNICIIPDKKTQKLYIDLSQKIGQKFPTNFVLNQKNKIPHISLYHLGIPEKNKNKLINLVESISKRHQPFQVGSKDFYQYDNFLCINVEISLQLSQIHQDVVDSSNPLRNGLLRSGVEELLSSPNLNQQKKKYIQEYGYFLVKKEFIPHVTLTNFPSSSDLKLAIKEFSAPQFSFTAGKIFITKIGPFGTVPEVISEHRLK